MNKIKTYVTKIDWDVLLGIRVDTVSLEEIGYHFRLKLEWAGIYRAIPVAEMFTLELHHQYTNDEKLWKGYEMLKAVTQRIINQFVDKLKWICANGYVETPLISPCHGGYHQIGHEVKHINQIYSIKVARFIHERTPEKIITLVNFPSKEKYENMLKQSKDIAEDLVHDYGPQQDFPFLFQQILTSQIANTIVRMYQ